MNNPSIYVFLPTDKASEIYIGENGLAYKGQLTISRNSNYPNQYIYILQEFKTLEDRCKKGEWKYCSFTNEVTQYDPFAEVPGTGWCEECRKIIATNDSELNKKLFDDGDKLAIASIAESDIEYIISLYNSKSKSVDVEDLALGYVGTKPEVMDEREIGKLHGFIDGYNQCLQDNADEIKKLNERVIHLLAAFDNPIARRNHDDFQKDAVKDVRQIIELIDKEQPKSNTVMVEYESIYGESDYVGISSPLIEQDVFKPKINKDGNIIISRS